MDLRLQSYEQGNPRTNRVNLSEWWEMTQDHERKLNELDGRHVSRETIKRLTRDLQSLSEAIFGLINAFELHIRGRDGCDHAVLAIEQDPLPGL